MPLLALLAAPITRSANASTNAAGLVLAAEGKSNCQIIVPDASPTPAIGECLNQTARLVQTAFKANGADVPVVTESKRDPARPGIFLGDTTFARTKGVTVAQLKGWGYVHKVAGRDVIIAGRDQPSPGTPEVAMARRPTWDRLGTTKGAADFLRQYAGTRFLYPDLEPLLPIGAATKLDLLNSPAIEFLPLPVIAVPADLNVQNTPPIEFNTAHPARGSFYDIANNRFPVVDAVFGGHTYERAIPVEKHHATHPEYFALVGGQRIKRGQYCISNLAVQELIYRDMIGWLDRGYATVDLGQPDGFQPCECERCAKLFDCGADWGEKLWILHRKLAERVLASHPAKQVTMMSYILTAAPPKTFRIFPKNTRIMLCGTNEEDIAPWRDCVVPGGFTSYLYNWCPNLGTRYTAMRTPGFVEDQAKRLVRNKIQAIYRDGPGGLFGLEGPVYYVMGRMFDDAENNRARELVVEFCEAAFGKDKAARPMQRFYDQLYHGIELYSDYLGTRAAAWTYHDIYGKRRKHLSDPFQLLGFLYPPNLLAALETDLSQAEKAAPTGKIKSRLALVRREFDYVKSLARVIHLYHAFQIQPDLASRDRLLDAIDARNAEITGYYDARGRARNTPGWPFVMFPPGGHNAAHLQLAYDGYQEPFATTPLNWDTKAMRKAPLPGTKRLSVSLAQQAITLDATQWERAAAHELTGLPANVKVTRPTIVRALYDHDAICLRLESALSPEKTTFAAVGRDGDLGKQESLDIYLAPQAGRDVFYRFIVGPHADSKYDAASGFITDAMDPRHGKDDPSWNGDWTYESRLNVEAHRWFALLKIPFKTLGVEPPAAGTAWRGNIGRVHIAGPDRIERSIWAASTSTASMDDRSAFGEIVFEGASASKRAAP